MSSAQSKKELEEAGRRKVEVISIHHIAALGLSLAISHNMSSQLEAFRKKKTSVKKAAPLAAPESQQGAELPISTTPVHRADSGDILFDAGASSGAALPQPVATARAGAIPWGAQPAERTSQLPWGAVPEIESEGQFSAPPALQSMPASYVPLTTGEE